MAKNISLESTFRCVLCGNRGIPIVRRVGSEREAGHLKKLYCLYCKAETNHAECKQWTKYSEEDFEYEFDNGNFNEDGTRKMPYGKFKGMMNNVEKE